MTPYDRLKQAVRDGDTHTVLFLLAWLDGSLTTQDQVHATDHMGAVQKALGEALHELDTYPALRKAAAKEAAATL